ncbi:MAG: M23 family metallopeptidase [bacterium]
MEPLPGRLFALFDRAGYAAYPNDTSLRFVRESEVVSTAEIAAPNDTITYANFLRSEVFYLHRPPLDGTNYVITGSDTYHLEEDGFGDFAWDIVVTDDVGVHYRGNGTANEDFRVWGQTVKSMTNGVVIDVVRDSIDNVPGSHPPTDVAVNNWVGVSLGGSYYVYYLHFQNDGIDPGIEVGTPVRIGDPLGVVGNTGVSLEPHVHVVLLWYDVGAQRSYSVPIEFNTVESADSPTGPFVQQEWFTPTAGTWIR